MFYIDVQASRICDSPLYLHSDGWALQNPIAFHIKMMCDIMFLQQALRKPDAKEFVHAVIKEVD
jgi:hypothetical protein